jgi:sortase A
MTPRRSVLHAVLLGAMAALLAAAGVGMAAWAVTAPDGGRAATAPDGGRAATTVATTAAATTTLVEAPVPTAPPPPPTVGLPTPENAPADPNAPTPDVVHGTLALPTIGVSQPLHEGVTLTAIDRGPSHWPGTALPGQLGNVVVAGHRVTHTRPFYDLDRLAPGDPLVFTMADGSTWTYTLVSTEVVTPEAMHIVDQTPEYTATLFACHPKHSARERIVAHFVLAS